MPGTFPSNFLSQELRTRSAAVFSLRGFFETLLQNGWLPVPSRELLDLYMVLYGTLIDDDEDIRDQSAATVSLLLSAEGSISSEDDCPSFSLSPPAAKHRLLLFLQESFKDSKRMHMKAIEKMIGLKYPIHTDLGTENSSGGDNWTLRPVAEILTEAQTPDTAVFVEEKQNLYEDAVEEAELWAALLIALHVDEQDAVLYAPLELWTEDGLLHLLDKCKKENDNSIGFASNPDVFLVITRVILSVKVLMNMMNHLAKISAKQHEKGNVHERLLTEFLVQGKDCALHGLLIQYGELTLQTIYYPSQQRL